MSSIDIFYKSYSKDFWLLYISLDTLKKNVTGYSNVIILIPEHEKELFDTRNLPDRTLVHYVKEYGDGYLFQQACKLNAHNYCYSEFIMYSDSDCIYTRPVNLQDYINNGRPEILYTDYKLVADAICWQVPTETMMGHPVQWEFMRRNNGVFHRSTLENINQWKPGLETIVMSAARFSEFNFLGAYAFDFETEKYTFINTEAWQYTPPMADQIWSHADKDGDATHMKEWIRILETIMTAYNVPVPKK